jgi:hypothetical protein
VRHPAVKTVQIMRILSEFFEPAGTHECHSQDRAIVMNSLKSKQIGLAQISPLLSLLVWKLLLPLRNFGNCVFFGVCNF